MIDIQIAASVTARHATTEDLDEDAARDLEVGLVAALNLYANDRDIQYSSLRMTLTQSQAGNTYVAEGTVEMNNG